MTYKPDIGNLHIIDYYLHLALHTRHPLSYLRTCEDFDIATEQREGWAYDYE